MFGFEQTLWATADKMRGQMDAAEYKHVALELIFLKYISDAFQELYDDLAQRQETEFTDPEDRDKYLGMNIFWVPKEAQWAHIQANAKQPTIGKPIDDAMQAIENENPRLKGVLPIQYARPELDKQRLGELIDLISKIGLGDTASRSKDILGRVYEYFLGQFADKEGKGDSDSRQSEEARVMSILIDNSLLQRITIDPEICQGKPCIRWFFPRFSRFSCGDSLSEQYN